MCKFNSQCVHSSCSVSRSLRLVSEEEGELVMVTAISLTRITIIIPLANRALDTSGSDWCLEKYCHDKTRNLLVIDQQLNKSC